MTKVIRIKSPAKLNLFLEVLGKRPDGFHEIVTVMQAISLFDHLEIRENKKGIRIKSDNPILPVDRTNLVYQAAELFKNRYGIKQGVEITISKRIPIGGGLGGGSSNAASTLMGLSRLWRLSLSLIELSLLARQIGADCPFFISGPTALCKGRGEIVFSLPPDQVKRHYLIIYPGFPIPTKKIYQNLKLDLTKPGPDVNIFVTNLKRHRTVELFNRLEEAVFRVYPQIKVLKTRLQRLGLSQVVVSGSGSCLFGPVESKKEGSDLAEKIKGQNLGRVFLVNAEMMCRR